MIADDYINSGILQDYCLGLLDNENEIKVEVMCKAYPQVAMELQLLRQALEKYTGSENVQHNSALRKQVWETVKKMWEENT